MAKVTANDFVETGTCVKGIRFYCEQKGIDFRDFVRNGMDEETLLSYGGNAQIDRAIAHMKKRDS